MPREAAGDGFGLARGPHPRRGAREGTGGPPDDPSRMPRRGTSARIGPASATPSTPLSGPPPFAPTSIRPSASCPSRTSIPDWWSRCFRPSGPRSPRRPGGYGAGWRASSIGLGCRGIGPERTRRAGVGIWTTSTHRVGRRPAPGTTRAWPTPTCPISSSDSKPTTVSERAHSNWRSSRPGGRMKSSVHDGRKSTSSGRRGPSPRIG